MTRQPLKYLDGDPRHGIDYDWNLIKKEFKKLGIPKEVYNPYKFHKVVGGKYIMDISERDTGKSTNWLLLAMVINRLYGSEIVYMRELVDMISPRNDAELFKTILNFHYVEKLTDGQYNAIRCRSRRYYFWNRETGDEETEPFLVKWSLDENELKKSSVQLPDSDIIIFDEFISHYNYMNEFVTFADSLKSIIRERDCPLIVLLANTTDTHSQWFKEFEIYDDVQTLQAGESKVITSSGGSTVDIAWVGKTESTMSEHRKAHNSRFFGFANPKLNSIRGGAWATRVYQHPYNDKDIESILQNRYIRHNGHLLRLEVCFSPLHKYYVVVHLANEIQDDSIVYCLDTQLENYQYKYMWGTGKIDNKLWEMYQQNKWTFVSNMEGTLVDDFMRSIKQIKRGL